MILQRGIIRKPEDISGYKEYFNNDRLPIWNVESPGNGYNLYFSPSIVREGTHSQQFQLRRDDALVNGSKRCELSRIKPSHENRLESHVYKFSTYLPSGGAEDWGNGVNDDEIIAQWHATPDEGETYELSPPLSLHLGYGNNYYLVLYSDPNQITTPEMLTANGYPHSFDLFDWLATKGYWVDWEFRIKWGWTAQHNPKIEVYKQVIGVDIEKTLVITITEPNYYNDIYGAQFSFGIYKPQWALENYGGSEFISRIIYFDSVLLD